METLNRYIDGEKKTRSDDGFAWYRRIRDAEYGLAAHGNLAAAAASKL